MTRHELIEVLPPYEDKWILVNSDQNVSDIIRDILDKHKKFASYYDLIALYFNGDTIEETCRLLYNFCKNNIEYKEEKDKLQTTALPTGILVRGYGDCKHYASFIGGCLDAIKRLTGKKINWCYRFASYDPFVKSPHHVFIVVKDNGQEYWVDPTPGANGKNPMWLQDRKINTKVSGMPLMSNIGALYSDVNAEEGGIYYVDQEGGITQSDSVYSGQIPLDLFTPEESDDSQLSQEIIDSITLLYENGVLDSNGNFNDAQVYNLQFTVDADQYRKIMDAVYFLDQKAAIGGLFQTIFRGLKKVTLAAPRGAYLSLVALNVFGLGTKLAQATSTEAGANKIRNVWYAMGGDWKQLRSAISNGSKRKKILGAEIGVVQAAIPAWITVAAAIITALAPVIKSILQQQQKDQVPYVEGYDPSLIQTPETSSGGIMQTIKDHPLEAAGVGLILFLLIRRFV